LRLEGQLRRLEGGHRVKMPKCSFCRKNYEFPKGVTVVMKDGGVKYFCSSKCRKNSKMGRKNKKVNWVRKSDVVKEEKVKREAAHEAAIEA